MVEWVTENSPKSVSAKQAKHYVDLAVHWADKRALDPMLVLSIMRHESYFVATAKSGYGAQGLMQVVPRWHRDKLGKRSLYNPAVAIEVGTQVLADCMAKVNGHTFRALRCYLGGNPNRYYARIEKSHVAMKRTVRERWFLAEKPFHDLPKVTMTHVVLAESVHTVKPAELPVAQLERRYRTERSQVLAMLSK